MARYWLGIDFGTSGVRAIAVDALGNVAANVRSGIASGDGLGQGLTGNISNNFPGDFSGNSANNITNGNEPETDSAMSLGYRLPQVTSWREGLRQVLANLPLEVRSGLAGIVIDGTSATVVLCNRAGVPMSRVLTYSDGADRSTLAAMRAIMPAGHLAASATATLPKVAQLWQELTTQCRNFDDAPDFASDFVSDDFVLDDADDINIYVMHQADLCGYWLHGRVGITDYHNVLKLGYDPVRLAYPDWLQDWLRDRVNPHRQKLHLPQVLAPGEPVGLIGQYWVETLGINPDCVIGAGTTDSTAAFLASIAPSAPALGMAVTSLGSTMVMKVLAAEPLTDLSYGVYSHRWDQGEATFWLVGGASNTGGRVLRQFFSDQKLRELTEAIDPEVDSPLDYYPLPQMGERFPVNDPNMLPRLSPRPENSADFLHGLLTSMARIEAQSYGVLRDLGAPLPQRIYTAGGGAQNPVWTRLRQRQMGDRFNPMPQILAAQETEAAYGAALLGRMKIG